MEELYSNIVGLLLQKSVGERAKYFNATFSKNKKFFRKESQELFDLLVSEQADNYEIELTEQFFNIKDLSTNQYLHQRDKLESECRDIEKLINNNCNDFINENTNVLNDISSFTYQTFISYERMVLKQYKIGPVGLKSSVNPLKPLYAPVAICLGISPGLLMLEYLSKISHSHILIYEPDPLLFILSCYFVDYSWIKSNFKKYYLAVGPNSLDHCLSSLFNSSHYAPLCWTRVLSFRSIPKEKMLISSIKSMVHRFTVDYHSLEYSIKMNQVIPSLMEGNVNLLTNKRTLEYSSNIVLVASGPSLEQDLTWLKENQSKTIIFCVFSAIGLLNQCGIKPDFIFTMDAFITEKNMKFLLKYSEGIPLVTTHQTSERLLKYMGKLFVCGNMSDTSIVKFKEPLNFNGSSTVCLALRLALFFKPNFIFMLGCDFSYGSNKEYNSKGTLHDMNGEDFTLKDGGFAVPKNNDETKTVFTDSRLYDYMKSIEVIIKEYISNSTKIYNLSQNGAHISGALPIQASEIKLAKPINKIDKINTICSAFEPARQDNNWEKFKGSGSSLLEKYKCDIFNRLKVPVKDWDEMMERLDFTAFESFYDLKQEPEDGRLGIYLNFINAFLRFTYIFILSIESYSKATSLYYFSIDYLEKKLCDMNWPKKLEGF